jgi:hypothetical protein
MSPVTYHRLYKEKLNLKRKYEEGCDYTEGMATPTIKQNRLTDMIGSGP